MKLAHYNARMAVLKEVGDRLFRAKGHGITLANQRVALTKLSRDVTGDMNISGDQHIAFLARRDLLVKIWDGYKTGPTTMSKTKNGKTEEFKR